MAVAKALAVAGVIFHVDVDPTRKALLARVG